MVASSGGGAGGPLLPVFALSAPASLYPPASLRGWTNEWMGASMIGWIDDLIRGAKGNEHTRDFFTRYLYSNLPIGLFLAQLPATSRTYDHLALF